MIADILGTFDLVLALQIAAKISLAMLLGGLVGWERERHNMPAGIRTFILVSVGSCMFTVLSYIGFGGDSVADSARVAAQIVSGIGFLGAGVVMQRKGTVHGLTSAAGIWSIAAVGMAVGTGNYFLAVFGAAAIFIIMGLLRQLFKARVIVSTRRTLNIELHHVRNNLTQMNALVRRAILDAIQAIVDDDHDLAQQIIDGDTQINELRSQVDQECLDILRAHHPQKVKLRTVIAATNVAANLERMGDHAKAVAQIRLQMGHELPLLPLVKTPVMADRVADMLERVLHAFLQDDVAAARRIIDQVNEIRQMYQDVTETVTEKMTVKKSKQFERGVFLINIAYNLNRVAERVTNIAEQIVFVRTGAIEALDQQE